MKPFQLISTAVLSLLSSAGATAFAQQTQIEHDWCTGCKCSPDDTAGSHNLGDRLHAHLGPSHRFRISRNSAEMPRGNCCFQYEGVGITVLDPWPATWPDNWYDGDDVYIDCTGDACYLHNPVHPKDRIAITFNIR